MKTELRILMIEDNESDAELLLRQLEQADFSVECQRVETAEDMLAALKNQKWDLIISDYQMPNFEAPAALALFKSIQLDIPFIVVSGKLGEETAVALMKAGADDYLMKSNMAKLPLVVKRELSEAHNRRELKIAEESLIAERKLAEVELRNSRDEALKSSNIKSEFLANMSHEIRTPLNAILGMAHLLAETKLDMEQRKFVEILDKSGDHLLRLIDNILDLTKMESGGFTLVAAPFDLSAIVRSSMDLLKSQAQSKALKVTSKIAEDVPLQLIGDAQRLRQVLVNLLNNAVKFTEKGEVVLQIERDQSRPLALGAIVISVTDTGIGIPAEQIPKLFQRFTQGNSSVTKTYGGSGLGLSISKHLVELMGGTIDVESTEGVGSKFSLHLSLPTSEETLPTSNGLNIPVDLRPLRILAVDDSQENLMLVQHFLKKTNYKIESAGNGKVAVEKFKNEKFDLILMDIQMPIMDGYTATQAIREIESEERRPATPIIALTAYVQKEDEKKSYEAGCDFHLTKPINKKKLLETILRIS